VYVFPEIIRYGQELEMASESDSFHTDVNVSEVVEVCVVRDGEVDVGLECDRREVNVGEDEELVSEVPVGLVESNVALVCHQEVVSEVQVGVSAVDSLVLCDEEVPISDDQNGDVEVNLEMMCDGMSDRSEEIEDGSFVSFFLLWCVPFLSVLLIFWNVF
jgi:hypothetical protein